MINGRKLGGTNRYKLYTLIVRFDAMYTSSKDYLGGVDYADYEMDSDVCHVVAQNERDAKDYVYRVWGCDGEPFSIEVLSESPVSVSDDTQRFIAASRVKIK
jgi:hypothetical protein